ncbi:MAG TPA: glycoside hydrolase family 3 C-terminal domain-containing protein [Rariglobus sp.]
MRLRSAFSLTLLLAPLCAMAEPDSRTAPLAEEHPRYLNTQVSIDERIADLISRLTLEQKAALLNHKGTTVTVDSRPILSDQWNQCLNGVSWDRPTTLFPTCIAMAATWNTDLVQNEIARVLSDEARAIYNLKRLDPKAPGQRKGLIYRAPVINVERNPYWGRNFEAWSEDPFLTGRMAVAYVRGIQGDDPRYLKLAATLKHYAVNNVEFDRMKLNAVVSERMLREYWLPHFHDAVVEGKAQSLMGSYNAINGTPNNINHWLLTDLLKKEWKHEGFVVSDAGGIHFMVDGHGKGKMPYLDTVAQALMSGCDFSDKEFEQYIPAAVREGKVTESRLDDALTRVQKVRFRLGEFDPFESVPYSKISPQVIDSPAHRAIALKVAQQSIVLLQNRDRLLPLDKTKLKRIAVLGPCAGQAIKNGYNGQQPVMITALQGLKNRAAPGTEILFGVGGVIGGPKQKWVKTPDESKIDRAAELQKAVELARAADVAVVCVGTNPSIEQEDLDRKSLALPGTQQALVEAVLAANPRTIVVLFGGGPLTIPWIKEHAPAVVQAWWPGEEGGHAIADVLFGDVNPAGRLPHTVYASEQQVPPQDEYDVTKGFTYMYLNGAPLYAFGHGLSYTTFKYSDLRLNSKSLPADGTLTVSIDVQNTGKRAGDEVAQLYVHEVNPVVKRPAKELRGFQRVNLQPGEKRTITLTLPASKLAYWDESTHAFVVNPGPFDILVGASSEDIREITQITVSHR